MKTSKFLQLNARDLFLGIFMAFITSVLAAVIQMLESGTLFTWDSLRPVLTAGLCAGLTYLLKNLLSNSRGELFMGEMVSGDRRSATGV